MMQAARTARFGWVLLGMSLLAGCATPVQRGSIPVVDASVPLSGAGPAGAAQALPPSPRMPAAAPQDSGVVVMVPQAPVVAPIQTFPAAGAGFELPAAPALPQAPAAVQPSAGVGALTLSADEQLDGPVLALLTSAQQMERSGNLGGASASLERAQRIAPREPQVLYRLAEVRLTQGDAAQAEQLARRGLSYAGGRQALQASLWDVIARARDRQGDAAGAAEARRQARTTL